MKFVLLVEGSTEHKALPDFMRRAFSTKSPKERIGFQPVKFEGWADLDRRVVTKANFYLDEGEHPDVIGVLSLLDLYGPAYPDGCTSIAARKNHFKMKFETAVGNERFRHFSAVHEIEAWLLSDSRIFPGMVGTAVAKVPAPENVNFDRPPAVFLDRLYEQYLKESYKKTVHGVNLFRDIDPALVESKCSAFNEILSWLVSRATVRGLM